MNKHTQQMMKVSLLVIAALQMGCAASEFNPFAEIASKVDVQPDASKSTMKVTGLFIADGSTPSIVDLVIRNKEGTPLKDVAMNLVVSGAGNSIVPCTPSAIDGKSRCAFYSTHPEVKDVVAKSTIELSQSVTLRRPPIIRQLAGFVSAGDDQRAPTGHRFVTSMGTFETPNVQLDGSGKKRAHTSVQATLTDF